ncbi:DoxX family protein [Acidihalobacter ferrooxydans]|uniref:DoxX family protein n=1 Tax=Acidihalobacter ferrooxydans TaxID=1765967 RepID=A0A1P8UDG5_9GAMM|nr:DoxX family protein [Acidihalobacter ferrooxydans]APZ41885.1 DoxX family protein [Acidihalobacter ferrooxydans]
MSLQKFLNTCSPTALSILRIIVGFLYMQHGTAKLFHYPMSMGYHAPFTLIWFAGILETFGGALVLFGLFTRPAAFLLSGEMAIAYFKIFAPKDFWPLVNHGEAAVYFCFTFLYLSIVGGGPWSLDRLLRHKQ